MQRLTARLILRAVLVAALLLANPFSRVAFAKTKPVTWSLSTEPDAVAPGQQFLARVHAQIKPGFHLYSLTTPGNGGPQPTTIKLTGGSMLEPAAALQPKPERHQDPNLNVPVEYFSGAVDFLVPVRVAASAPQGPQTLTTSVRFQACSDEICLPPKIAETQATINISSQAPHRALTLPAGYGGSRPSAPTGGSPLDLKFLLVAFAVGLAAIATPCVFPLVPLTMSVFVQQAPGSRASLFRQVGLFGAGIVVLLTGIGTLVTLVAGPFGVVNLASNPWVNGLVFLILVTLGISMLGVFELELPSSLLTRADQAARGQGILAQTLVGVSFALTSFACVGPFLGTLLATSLQGGSVKPVLAMAAFATGLTSPFLLLALFPSLLHRLPRSGAWLTQVKSVFGFVVLAVSLKYAASIDQVLHLGWLDHDRFLAILLALLCLLALYLLGQLRLPGSDGAVNPSWFRLLAGTAVIALAASLLPGFAGRPLGALDTFIPAPESGVMIAGGPAKAPAQWLVNRYEDALAQGVKEHKPVLVSFSGYACTNCHWMKANIFQKPDVASRLKDYILVELYTDGTDPASKRNQDFEQEHFSTVALPFYVLINPEDQRTLATQAGISKNTASFLSFLDKANLTVAGVAPHSAISAHS